MSIVGCELFAKIIERKNFPTWIIVYLIREIPLNVVTKKTISPALKIIKKIAG
jgi:hypothetical protein